MAAFTIREDDLRGPEIVGLLEEHLREMYRVSPAESVHALDLDGLRRPEITFWTVWDGPELVGCGALKRVDDRHGEIKSMRTAEVARGRGVASALLRHILEVAAARGFRAGEPRDRLGGLLRPGAGALREVRLRTVRPLRRLSRRPEQQLLHQNHGGFEMIVRDEQAGDVDAIFEVTRVAFLEPWYSSHTEQFIPSALRRAGVLTLSLVAEVDGRVVGHAAFSPVTMTDGSTGWFGLGPISVLPARQRQGIGKALIGEGLARLRALGAAGCVLVGDPEYYGRFGFRNVSGLVYPDAPAYAFQVLPFGDAIPQGVVHFHEGFEATSL